MIKLIHGSKGSGKTKRIIKSANDEITTARGNHVYITDTLMHTIDIDRRIKFVNITDYGVTDTQSAFTGFLKGMLAADSDITKVYIDGLNRFLVKPEDMKELMLEFEKISDTFGTTFTVTVSTDELPEFLKRYI